MSATPADQTEAPAKYSELSNPLYTLKIALENYVLVILQSGAHITGRLLSFDTHFNLVIADARETHRGTRRFFSLLLLRGDAVVALSSDEAFISNLSSQTVE
ncbi:putative U6 snRNA-associated Sm-like protein LSm3 [Giardia muris]|uniref:Putative U6 snRNA-associated Sm-like protein LSm3 n=1 Tax=Giardia muris TaxID=5742 RepID=A0A4Z1STE3_GIAMU|nr:putative U6 snRNA-associated Sm-like protein LSm3 [Giardia muris]|eukprot:TNJ29020.1 putative U6 snRNA-associated Sm-like protein LSm3 [Giardia muris]